MQRRQAMTAMGLAGCAAWGLSGCSLDTGAAGDPAGTVQGAHQADADTPRQTAVNKTYPLALVLVLVLVLSSGGPRGFVHVGVDMARIESLALDANLTSLFCLNLTGEGRINAACAVEGQLAPVNIGGKHFVALMNFKCVVALSSINQEHTEILQALTIKKPTLPAQVTLL